MKDRYAEGLAHGWEDCKEAIRETLARRDITDRQKLELISAQVKSGATAVTKADRNEPMTHLSTSGAAENDEAP
jgi:Fe-S cluster assembly scaffold protein SufB